MFSRNVLNNVIDYLIQHITLHSIVQYKKLRINANRISESNNLSKKRKENYVKNGGLFNILTKLYCDLAAVGIHWYSNLMLLSGGRPTQALNTLSMQALCLNKALTTGVFGATKGALHK